MTTRLQPTRLPAVRKAIAQQIQEKLARVAAENRNTSIETILKDHWNDADELKVAPLWWVSHDMFLLALDAAESHTDPREQHPPTPTGFIYFDGQLPTFSENGIIFPHVCAITWALDSQGKLALQYYTDKTDPEWDAPLMPFEPDPEYVDSFGFQKLHQLAIRLLRTVWALSSIPTIAQVKHTLPQTESPSAQRYEKRIRDVKILTLREQKQTTENTIDPTTRKPYTHRFIVRGFYRNQAYGKNLSQRRKQWIPPFVKGPADKPLIIKETVRVWKR